MTMNAAVASNFRTVIDDQLAVHMAKQPAMGAAASMRPDFCSIWPEAKPILQILVRFVPFIPGVGAPAAAILMALLGVADQVYASTCNVSPTATP